MLPNLSKLDIRSSLSLKKSEYFAERHDHICIPMQRVPLGFSSGEDAKELGEDIFPLLGFLAGSAASRAPDVAPAGARALHNNSLALRHDRRRTRTLEGGG